VCVNVFERVCVWMCLSVCACECVLSVYECKCACVLNKELSALVEGVVRVEMNHGIIGRQTAFALSGSNLPTY
jgi:hypothetical protein